MYRRSSFSLATLSRGFSSSATSIFPLKFSSEGFVLMDTKMNCWWQKLRRSHSCSHKFPFIFPFYLLTKYTTNILLWIHSQTSKGFTWNYVFILLTSISAYLHLQKTAHCVNRNYQLQIMIMIHYSFPLSFPPLWNCSCSLLFYYCKSTRDVGNVKTIFVAFVTVN